LRAVAERTVYDYGGWSLSTLHRKHYREKGTRKGGIEKGTKKGMNKSKAVQTYRYVTDMSKYD
jgi:hypothetical protein